MLITTLFSDPAYFFYVVVIVIASISVHECFHALAALWQGDDTAARLGRITLNPMAHMSQTAIVMLMLLGITWGSTPVSEGRLKWRFSPVIVGFAGPFANLLLLVLSVWAGLLLVHFKSGLPAGMSAWQEAGMEFFSLAAMLNAFLFLLNMLPIPPLDGFGILETFLPVLRRYSFSLSQYGFFILIVLFMFLGLGNLLRELAGQMVWKVAGFSQGMVSAL
jgi:Zn-dependent protease